MSVLTYRSNPDGDVLYAVVSESGRFVKKRNIEGFAVRRTGQIEPMTDEEWAILS